jgi:hypothetical protein
MLFLLILCVHALKCAFVCRATLNSVQQLKSALASATDQPSTKLLDYFQVASIYIFSC